MDIQAILKYQLVGNPVSLWAEALGYAVLVTLVLYGARLILVSRLGALAQKTTTHIDDLVVRLIAKTRLFVIVVFGLRLGAARLDFSDPVTHIIDAVGVFAILFQAGLWGSAAIAFWVENYGARDRQTGTADAVVKVLGVTAKIVLWSGVLLFALDNVGVKVTALVTGLGIGGVAVALALQNILGNLFASLSIVLDKPFVVGDFIIVGDFLGSVENIGLRTVRVRSLSGEQIVFSNNDLLASRVRNYGRMFRRRVLFTIGVTYQTPREKLEKIPGMLKQAVEEQEKVTFDRAHFKAYGAYSLDFEIVYYVEAADYNTYMDIQQAINLRIHEFFENEEIEFAYPTQTLFHEGLARISVEGSGTETS